MYAIGLPENKESAALSLSADVSKAAWWAKTWGMLFSAEKSDVLTITGKREDHPETDVNMTLRGSQWTACLFLFVRNTNTLVSRSTTACRGRIMLTSCTRHVLERLVCCAPCARGFQVNVSQRFILGTFIFTWKVGIRMRYLEWRQDIEVVSSS